MKYVTFIITFLCTFLSTSLYAGVATDGVAAKSIIDIDDNTVEKVRSTMNGFVSDFENLPAYNQKPRIASALLMSGYLIRDQNLVFENEKLTYAQLNARANQLAVCLQDQYSKDHKYNQLNLFEAYHVKLITHMLYCQQQFQ